MHGMIESPSNKTGAWEEWNFALTPLPWEGGRGGGAGGENRNASGPPLTSAYLENLILTLGFTRFFVLRIAAIVVVAVGITGNIVNILVLTTRSMKKSSTSYYLCALAAVDILYLTFALTMTFAHDEEASEDDPWHRRYYRYKNTCGRVLTDVWSNAGVWLTITFTVERYVGICYPIRGKLWCTTAKARRVIPVVCLLAAAATFPEFFEYRIVPRARHPNVTVLTKTTTAFGNSTVYHVYNHAKQSLFAFVPLVLLMFFNALLVRAVVRAARDRRALTVKIASLFFKKQERHRRREQGITVTLITVVLVFVVCQLPQAVHQLHGLYLDALDRRTKAATILLRIQANYFNLLVMVNASANFLLYSAFSYEFRRSFKRLLSRRRRGTRTPVDGRRDEEPLRSASKRGSAPAVSL